MIYRIVIDTNVLVSTVLNPHDKPAAILDAVIDGDLSLIFSPAMLEEAIRVFSYPKIQKILKQNRISFKEVKNFIDRLNKTAIIVPGQTKLDVIKDDPDDNIILACALEGKAHYIISGDQHLTSLKTYQTIKSVTPAVFLSQQKNAI
jgi:putative PIN family toxin of toxin-antitoxin system